MAGRIMGPTGSVRRRRWLGVPIAMVMLVALFWIAGAQAVHDDGYLQLDRNAFTSDTIGAPYTGHDWDQVYDPATYGSAGTTIKSFQTDGAEATFFVGDRFDGNGTATLGVWFFQSNVAPLANGSFSGSHVDGDVLVLTDFQSSGANATVRVFRWNGSGLTLIAGDETTPADCVGPPSVPANDSRCGTTNSENELSPWPFTPKVPVDTNIFPVGHFFEGGIDLAALGLGGQCFSSFLAETRTSNSI